MSPVAAPADRRFHRSHVKPARRRQWRTAALRVAAIVLLSFAGAYSAYRAGTWFVHSSVLQIRNIVVRGNAQLSAGEVLAVLNGLKGQNIIWSDLQVWRRRLLASPWVREAALHRSLPATIEVTVAEREPIGIGRFNGGLYLIDEHGVVIDEYGPKYVEFDLPIVEGVGAESIARPDDADEARAQLAARVFASLKPNSDIARRLSQIDVNDVHNAAVTLTGDSALIYVGEERFLQRLESYVGLSAALRERVPNIDYVDLRFDDRIYVRPLGKAARSGTPAKR